MVRVRDFTQPMCSIVNPLCEGATGLVFGWFVLPLSASGSAVSQCSDCNMLAGGCQQQRDLSIHAQVPQVSVRKGSV